MEERSYRFAEKDKEPLLHLLFEEKGLPDMSGYEVERVSYEDGCKVYFVDGSWVSARFSGTEPLLRIFCEMRTQEEAIGMCNRWKSYLGV